MTPVDVSELSDNDLVGRIFSARAVEEPHSQSRFVSFDEILLMIVNLSTIAAALSTTYRYIEFNKYLKNAKYQSFSNFHCIFTLNHSILLLVTGFTAQEQKTIAQD